MYVSSRVSIPIPIFIPFHIPIHISIRIRNPPYCSTAAHNPLTRGASLGVFVACDTALQRIHLVLN